MELVVNFPGGKKIDADFKGFTINTDQPVQAGGTGTAPAPFDLFLASIGTCAGIYIQGFCQSRGLSTENMKIIQKMEYDPAKKLIGKISLEIQIPEDFPEKYKDAIINAAELCAVKKHLQDPPEFSIFTNVVEDANV